MIVRFCSHIGLLELVPLILTLQGVKIYFGIIYSLQQSRIPYCNWASTEQCLIYKDVELIIDKLLYITVFFVSLFSSSEERNIE